jgi:aspartokinase
MTQNITTAVNSFINNDFITRKALLKNIVSLRALTRHIINQTNLSDENFDAIMSSIRRYKTTKNQQSEVRLKKSFSNTRVKTRSDITDIRIQKTRKNTLNIGKLNSEIDIEKGDLMRVIQAEQSITLIIDSHNFGKFSNYFSKSDYISLDKGLVEINIQFSLESQETQGILALVTSSLNSDGINIVEIMSSAPELILIVKKSDLIKSLNVLDKMNELA